jgi:formylglycine-generating enzyme required for sulfatase activity
MLNNPIGAKSGPYRVIRGGSWISGAAGCPSDARSGHTPDLVDYSLGFRLVFVQ